jgi:glutathione synthase/RimK-type ligase-like ATP-grasp enzyme
MAVLILSSLDDSHALAVMEALRSCSVTPQLLDLSEFPERLALSMAFENGSHRFVLRRAGYDDLDFASVHSVWWRRPQPFRFPPALSNPTDLRFARSEAATAFFGLYQALDAFWVNDPVRDEAAHHKPWQLALAQKMGLGIPITLMTNDPEEARDFWRQHEGNVIYKQFRATAEVWSETRRLREEEMALVENVRVTPVIFQRYVDAIADIRVTVIGDGLFAAAADMRNAEYPLDFRYNLNLPWKRHELPKTVEDNLLQLTRRFGLEYGAIDLRLTPEGEYIFLEINPAGQFLWIEHATGQKIAQALAAHLVSGREPSSHNDGYARRSDLVAGNTITPKF